MWLVRLALRRPYTIAVSCLLIMILGVLSLTRMTVDIFPVIDILHFEKKKKRNADQ